ISVLIDQLEVPWSPPKIVRVLINNLRPEIRHEQLNVEIKTVSKLWEICRRRETFLDNVQKSQGYAKRTPFRREVAEVVERQTQSLETDSEGDIEIEAISLVCWNCRMQGHRYQDCVSDRRVFCYGCGAANTYKPSCSKCSKNSKPGTSKSAFKPKTSSASRSQSTMTD
ncbi:hypothetical protein KR018_001341, partial [Drosophila ironensis]